MKFIEVESQTKQLVKEQLVYKFLLMIRHPFTGLPSFKAVSTANGVQASVKNSGYQSHVVQLCRRIK